MQYRTRRQELAQMVLRTLFIQQSKKDLKQMKLFNTPCAHVVYHSALEDGVILFFVQ